MIRYQLAGMDLAEARFAMSPLNELALSLRAWRDPGRYPLHLPWLHRVQEAAEQLDGELLLALTDTRLWTLDFLTPRPRSPLTRIDDELDALARTPLDVVDRDLRAVHADPAAGLPAALRGPTGQVLERVVQALSTYWERCFAPVWPRMQTLLEADVVFRGRQVAQHGLARMFSELAETVTFTDGVVSVRLHSPVRYSVSTGGEGLTLVPTLFTRNASAPISPAEPPLIMYGARGLGTLWERRTPPISAALADLLGRTRATLLTQLGEPVSGTELAALSGVTPSAINQHLRALHAAGLLTSARHGRSVLYRRSELGDRLVTPAGPPDNLP